MSEVGIPRRVGVVGGGRMGAGIAQVFAERGAQVTIAEAHDQQAARSRVDLGLRRAAQRDLLGGLAPETILERVSTVAAPTDIPGDVALVIEAVPEDPKLKVAVLAQLGKTLASQAIIASNTSSLSITELAAALPDPARFVGMHFFNPVPVSDLVEIIRGRDSATGVIETVQGVARALGKTAIVVNDSPGFATSRLGVHLGLEAIRMVAEGVAEPSDIDTAMELGYRHPMGPLRSTDLVGLDVRLAIAEHLAETLGPRFEPPQLLRDKVARGELGRKSGRGFYDWNTES